MEIAEKQRLAGLTPALQLYGKMGKRMTNNMTWAKGFGLGQIKPKELNLDVRVLHTKQLERNTFYVGNHKQINKSCFLPKFTELTQFTIQHFFLDFVNLSL